MKIAICDDDLNDLTLIRKLLDDYQEQKKMRVAYKCFSSSMELLEDMRTENFDVIFLDVMMPGINGMQAAHEIHSFDEQVKIIFLTSSPDFALESYAVKAYSYLLKPALKSKLYPILNRLLFDEESSKEYMVIKCKTGIVKLLFSKLSYVEVSGKKLFFHMSDKTIYETAASLSEYEKVFLTRPEFLKVHRAFLVNLWQMRELTAQDFVTLMGDRVPVSRRLYPKAREAFMKSLFSKIV
ncbi:MAG: LytTR family DNA-binding domain-containing protein [Coprobacillus sp.]